MASLLGELRRRNVFKVAVAYAIVGWLVVQIIVSIEGPLSLPEWTDTLVIVLLGAGFIVALVLTWAYELTPEGIKKSHQVPLEESTTHVTGQRLNYVITFFLVLVVGFVVVDQYLLEDAGQEIQTTTEQAAESSLPTVEDSERDVLPNSVAVLPFENLSPDPEDAYFAAGVHEEILGQLAKVSDLNVIARTSVLRYADDPPPIPEIADELNVQMVMEGSVRYAGEAIRVTAQLIDGASNTHLWTETYDGELTDIFAVQTEIAERIALALEAELLPAERRSIEQRLTDSPEALALYLKARATVFAPSAFADPALVDEIYELLDQALAFDENFAYAHAYKAAHYGNSTQGVLRIGDPLSRADRAALTREHARAALDIDPNVGLAYAALAAMNESFLREDEALANFQRAYALTPNQPDLLIDYIFFSARTDRVDDAVRLAQQLTEINPGYGDWVRGWLLRQVGRQDESISASYEALSLLPDYPNAHELVAVSEAARGNDAIALESLRLTENLWGDDFVAPLLIVMAIHTYGRIGRPDDARRVFTRLERMSAEYTVGDATWALAYLGLGDRERALQLLEGIDRTVPGEDFIIRFLIRANFFADPVLETPDFVEIRSRLGFRE